MTYTIVRRTITFHLLYVYFYTACIRAFAAVLLTVLCTVFLARECSAQARLSLFHFQTGAFFKTFFLRSVWCRVSSKLLRTTWLDVAAAGGANADFVVQELDRLPIDECVHPVLIPLMPYNGRNNHLSVALAFVTESIFLYEYKFGEHFAYYAVWRCEFVLLRHFLHFPLCRRVSISFQTSVILFQRQSFATMCVDSRWLTSPLINYRISCYYLLLYNI